MPIKTIKEFRGVSRLPRFNIGQAFAMSAKNTSSGQFPALQLQSGFTMLGSTAIGTKVLGLGVWKDTELHAVFSDGTWRKWTGSAWSAALASGLSTTAEWTFTNFKGGLTDINLIGTNGVDTMRRYDGSTVSTISDAPDDANFITSYADRCWCAVGNELHASAYRDATDWTTVTVPEEPTDSWWTMVETPDGETINGINAGLTKMTITKPSSIHHLYGYDPTDYEVRVKTFDFGAFNNKSMTALNGILHMVDPNAISQYEGGVLPYKTFSLPMQAYIDEINQTAKGTTCIGSDGALLYVSIPVSSSTSPDTMLVYDPKFNAWHVWESVSALQFAKVGSKFYFGDATGRVYEVAGTTHNGNAISWEWISGPITPPNMAMLLRWVTVWVTADVPVGSTFNVYISPTDDGDGSWTLIKSLPASGVVQSTSIYLSAVRAAATARYMRIKFTGTGPFTLHEWSRQEEYNPMR